MPQSHSSTTAMTASIKVQVLSATTPKRTSLAALLHPSLPRARAQHTRFLMTMGPTLTGNAALVPLIAVWVHSVLARPGSLSSRGREHWVMLSSDSILG